MFNKVASIQVDESDEFDEEAKRLKYLSRYVHSYRDNLAKVVRLFVCVLRLFM